MSKAVTLRVITILLGVIVAALALPGCAASEPPKYPSKPIEIVVSSAPGAATDSAVRLFSKYASDKWKVAINVVNKPGGSNVPGTLDVMNAASDGYTLLGDGHSTSTMLGAAQADLPFDIFKRTYIARVAIAPVFYAVRVESPVKTLDELLDYARKNPADFKFSAGTVGSIDNMSQTRLFQVAKVDANAGRVIFAEGHTPSLAALLGGHVSFGVAMAGDVKSLGGPGGKLRILGTTAAERQKDFLDIPTTKELGYPEANVVGWYGLSGPPNLPDAVVKAWESVLSTGAKDPAFLAEANKVGYVIGYGDSAYQKANLQKEYEIYLDIAKSTGMRK